MVGTIKELIPKMLQLDETKEYEVKEYKHKRSLNANAYYWVLVNKIADALNQSKEFIHLCMLKQYGQRYVVCVPYDVPIENLVKYYEQDGVRKQGDRLFKTYNVYLPSSEMNTKEMSKLIDGTVEEAQSMGIETMTPDEIADLKAMWGVENENKKK
ncbi:hypothetical protein [uncultured Megamonas sp.]|uniref:hypothetical protein n=1 Tax=uncultured Megamonas sp. TaxID=286140 RepID=UPI00259BBAF8|nr:hypothetical protein [uncultured Megamonas sp.]